MRKQTIAVSVIIIVVGAIIAWYALYYATPAPAQFTIQVTSRPTTPIGTEGTIMSLAGQRCIFLAVVKEEEDQQSNIGFGEPVQVTATGPDEMANVEVYPESIAMRDMFIPWLSTNHPELGITQETEWTGTIVNPRILVVMHYIFISDQWEIYLTWHVTIPPHDWTRIHLRNRYTEQRPSKAYEISSVKAQEEPHAIEVPEWA